MFWVNFMDKVTNSTLPTIILLSVVWTILAVALLFIKHQLKKEKIDKIKEANRAEKEHLSKEIDDLAVYVSKLPRSRDIIREYRIEEKDLE